MKDNLENILKDKLDNFELPYDAAAWSQMEAKLDAIDTPPPTHSKWYWAGGISALVLLSTLLVYTWNQENETRLSDATTVEVKEPTVSDNEHKQTENKITETSTPTSSESEEKKDEVVIEYNPETTNPDKKIREEITASNSRANSTPTDKPTKENNQDPAPVKEDEPVKKEVSKPIFTLGQVAQSTLCSGETLIIRNNSTDKKVKAFVNGNTFELLSNEQAKLSNITKSMQVEYLNSNNEVIGTDWIEVYEAPTLSFRTEANLFATNGLPVIQVSNFNETVQANWYLDNQRVSLNDNNEMYCYDMGEHTITFEAVDGNGCTFNQEQKVFVNAEFNLNAQNVIKPGSVNPENQSFMPHALTVMNVPFTLRIIDPVSGGVIYETSDVTQPWTGIDQRTGQMANYLQTYIWQVSLGADIENAPRNYRGEIILVQER